MNTNTATTSCQSFSYIEHMLIEMRLMSEKEDAPILAYLIEMAIIEARDMIGKNQNTKTLAGGKAKDVKLVMST